MSFIFAKKESIGKRYFKLVKNQLKVCDGSKYLLINKCNFKFSNENESTVELNVNEQCNDTLILANTGKKEIVISFEKGKNSNKYQLEPVPAIYKLKPNEAHDFTLRMTPLCTSKINETLYVVAQSKKEGIEKQKIQIEFSTKISDYIDNCDIDEREFLGLNEYKDMIWRGYCRGKPVIIDYRTNEDHQLFEREVKVLESMKCPTICYFYGACHLPHHECLIFDYYELGPLNKIISEREIPSEKIRAKICFDVAKALFYMHENGGIHRDVRLENIYGISLEPLMEVNVKLAGFSKARTFSIQRKDKEEFSEETGTSIYMSPELLQHEKYDTKVDVFAFGVTMIQVINWKIYKSKELLMTAYEQEKEFGNDFLSSELKDIIERCLEKELNKRATMGDVVQLFREYFS
ncbi:spindle assembly checkpoint kinase [Entamoeba histolytica HM-3:IMSS]|uniref:Spindle assembly checkpoint kinase n=1 Tax=Entamoeba histolytica HM-3:IMSS TaxID=885315 RepID=M7X9L8_ENTHI|nr:spindle assembly checkpoint kinase [Entamoeba histolytica HM-3:IMSS]